MYCSCTEWLTGKIWTSEWVLPLIRRERWKRWHNSEKRTPLFTALVKLLDGTHCPVRRWETGSFWKTLSLICQLSMISSWVEFLGFFQGHKQKSIASLSLLCVARDRIPERSCKPLHLTEVMTSPSQDVQTGNVIRSVVMETVQRVFSGNRWVQFRASSQTFSSPSCVAREEKG